MLHPSFWVYLGLTGYHSGLPLVVQMGSALPITNGAGRSSFEAPDRKIRAVEIACLRFFPRFLPHGRSHCLRTIGGNDKIFGRSKRKLWMETLGGDDGSRRGSVRTCFIRR